MSLVSVVIPTNRLDPWLDEAVHSVLAGTHEELELIVVLDGIALDPEPDWATDPRVIVLVLPENVGQATAMNKGVIAARGPYVARLDSDDVSEPERFALQSAYLDTHEQTVAVGSAVTRIDEIGRITGAVTLPSGADVRHDLLLANGISHSSLMFRRSAFDEVGGYDGRLRQMEDYVFILRLAQRGPIANLPNQLIRYRVHSSQTSRGASARGTHIDAVSRARMDLAQTIHASRVATRAKLLLWRLVQTLRHGGVLRPGHER